MLLWNVELRDTLAGLSQGSKFVVGQWCRQIMGHRENMMRPVGRSTPRRSIRLDRFGVIFQGHDRIAHGAQHRIFRLVAPPDQPQGASEPWVE